MLLAIEFQQAYRSKLIILQCLQQRETVLKITSSALSIKPTVPVSLEKHTDNLISFNKKLFVFLLRTLHSLLPPSSRLIRAYLVLLPSFCDTNLKSARVRSVECHSSVHPDQLCFDKDASSYFQLC